MAESYPIPLYYRVYSEMKKRIMEGYYEEGKLPSELELCREFDVSRMTVRKALEKLVMEGLIERKKGKGTFIKRTGSEEQLTKLLGLTEEIGKDKVSSKVLENRLVRVPEEAREVFGVPEGTLVLLLKRVRYVEGEPVAIEEAYLNPKVNVGILNILELDMSKRSLYEYLRKDLGMTLDHAEETIEVVRLAFPQARLLDDKPGSCALLRKRYTYTSGGECVEYVLSIYRGDKFKFRVVRR